MRLTSAATMTGAALLAAVVLAACSTDIAPVSAQGTVDCLLKNRRLAAARATPPAAIAPLARADGATRTVLTWRRGEGPRRAWAAFVVFDGAKAARAAAADVPRGLRSTRRQNIVVVFGRSDRYGRAPTPREERRLKECLRTATD